jgi:hypothetical protein
LEETMKIRIAGWTLTAFALAAVAAWAQGSAAKEQPSTTKVDGKWDMTREGPRGKTTSTLTLKQDGDKLEGTVVGGRNNTETPIKGSVKGDKITFSLTVQGRNGESRTMEFSGTVAGDNIKGTVETQGGSREWTAARAH